MGAANVTETTAATMVGASYRMWFLCAHHSKPPLAGWPLAYT
jgi:hypothetical protein